mgnify:CR=1 FL=1
MPSRIAIAVLLSAFLLLIHAYFLFHLQGDSCIDDAYVSFVYARNLSAGNGLVMNPGERVEGYTNFLWVVLMSVVDRWGFDLPGSARTINLALGATLVACAVWFLARARASRAPGPAALVAGVMLAVDGSVARWSQDGMETILFSLLVLAGVGRSLREEEQPGRYPLSAFWFGLAALTRPEGALFFAVSLAFRLFAPFSGRRDLRRLLPLVGIFSGIVLPYLTWRWLYYGYPLPNTFYAKVGATGQQVVRGAEYLLTFFLEQHWPLAAFLALALLSKVGRRLSKWHWHLLAFIGVYLLYVTAVGGDWMGPGRFMVPMLPLAVIVIAEIFTAAAFGTGSVARQAAAGSALLIGMAVTVYASGWNGEWASVSGERRYIESRLAVARWLQEHARPGDTVLANEIGQLAYHTGLDVADLYGLTDPRIAHSPSPPSMGRGKAGHEKFDLAYSFSLDPTWVCVSAVSRMYLERRDHFPPFRYYEAAVVDVPLPLELYRIVLHRRDAETARPLKILRQGDANREAGASR